jgi:hypothetical protein
VQSPCCWPRTPAATSGGSWANSSARNPRTSSMAASPAPGSTLLLTVRQR